MCKTPETDLGTCKNPWWGFLTKIVNSIFFNKKTIIVVGQGPKYASGYLLCKDKKGIGSKEEISNFFFEGKYSLKHSQILYHAQY